MLRFVLVAAAIGAGLALVGCDAVQAPMTSTAATPAMQQRIVANDGAAANSNNNYQAATLPGAVAAPAPGTMVLRMNGAVWSEFGVVGGTPRH
jgi:hypothetical protein